MTGLSDIPAYFQGAPLVAALAALGLGVGVLTGLFGVGGAFVVVPLMNVGLGIPYTLGAGCSMSFTIGTSAAGWARHTALGNVAIKTVLILAGSSVCGALLGVDLHVRLREGLGGGEAFTRTMHAMYVVTLTGTAALVAFWPPREGAGLSLLQRLPLPPRIEIRRAQLRGVSLPGLCGVGFAVGVLAGLLGIGGGVILVPLMLLAVGLGIRQAVGTSLGVVLFSSIVGAAAYGSLGQVNLWVVMPLLAGSSVGVQAGAWLCHRWHTERIRRYFAVFLVLVTLVVGWDLVRRLVWQEG